MLISDSMSKGSATVNVKRILFIFLLFCSCFLSVILDLENVNAVCILSTKIYGGSDIRCDQFLLLSQLATLQEGKCTQR